MGGVGDVPPSPQLYKIQQVVEGFVWARLLSSARRQYCGPPVMMTADRLLIYATQCRIIKTEQVKADLACWFAPIVQFYDLL